MSPMSSPSARCRRDFRPTRGSRTAGRLPAWRGQRRLASPPQDESRILGSGADYGQHIMTAPGGIGWQLWRLAVARVHLVTGGERMRGDRRTDCEPAAEPVDSGRKPAISDLKTDQRRCGAIEVLSPWCVKSDDGLDAGRPAEDQVRCLLRGITAGDER